MTKKGTKPGTIFFIHGNSSSSIIFKDFFNTNDLPYTLVAPDLPGHGENNTGSDDKSFSLNAIKKFLFSIIAEIKDDILLVGHSLGGHYAMEIAPEIKKLRGLIICGAPPIKKPINLEEAYMPVPELGTVFQENPEQSEVKNYFNTITYRTDVIQQLENEFYNTNSRVRSSIQQDIANGEFSDEVDTFFKLDALKILVNGGKDPLINDKYLANLNKKAIHPFKIYSIPESGHFVSLENPDAFKEIIKETANSIF